MSTTRTALGLYSSLLVLPTLIFIWLYWRELEKGFDAELAAVPEDAADGARRISSAMRDRFEALLEAERQRSFTDYGEYALPRDALGDEILPQRSSMTHRRLPTGILAWFTYGPRSSTEVLVGEDTFGRGGVAEAYLPIVEEFRRDVPPAPKEGLERGGEVSVYTLASVAVHMGQRQLECVKKCAAYMVEKTITARVSDFRLFFYVDGTGHPRAVATRHVSAMGLADLPEEAACLRPLVKGFELTQGFLIDVQWLLNELPFELARQILAEHEELRQPPRAGPIDELDTVFDSFRPIEVLGFEARRASDFDYGRLEVAIDTDQLQRRFRAQSKRLLAVSVMLVITLATGMTLLYRNVNRELEHAHRMQNFVAAVTHELRTPISTIRLHGEMLLDGWASDPAKQSEYYQRIVRETDRLSTLVENVLEKSRMTEQASEPLVGDLNEHVERYVTDLAQAGREGELELRLAPNLPHVWLTPDGVAGILSNLIENARKYAPPKPGGEPILVRTLWDGKRALLEVADRGPGVPASERERIFEAFYRVGSEATRTTTGTGLGLHLVRLHAEAAGAKVSVHDRDGGGSIFRIAWRPSTS